MRWQWIVIGIGILLLIGLGMTVFGSVSDTSDLPELPPTTQATPVVI